MNKLNLNLDYNVKHEEGTNPSPKDIMLKQCDLTKSYIEYAVSAHYRDGLDSQFRRLYGGIQKKIEAAIKAEEYEVQLEEGELNFIKAAFESKETKFTAPLARYVVVLEDELARIGTSNK